MVKNLRIYSKQNIKKRTVHKLIILLKKELNFTINNLEISFVNSADIIQVNREYLKHKNSTDIITFDYAKLNSSLEGEIIISYDDALYNSKRFRTSINAELLRLIIHGVLHLLGYKDKKRNDKRVIKLKENLLTHKYKFLAKEI